MVVRDDPAINTMVVRLLGLDYQESSEPMNVQPLVVAAAGLGSRESPGPASLLGGYPGASQGGCPSLGRRIDRGRRSDAGGVACRGFPRMRKWSLDPVFKASPANRVHAKRGSQ